MAPSHVNSTKSGKIHQPGHMKKNALPNKSGGSAHSYHAYESYEEDDDFE